jgi:hypothetical protein
MGRFYSRVQFNFALTRFSAARILQQLLESEQLIPTGIRDGAILQIARLPKDKVITIPRQLARQRPLYGGPAEDVDDVRAVPVDDYRGALMFQVVDTAADKLEALWLEVGDER